TRSDPFTGESRSHSGIDIDGYGCEGSAVTAADGGTVITATYNDGYGNYIIIDHGNGMQTLYAHLSGMAVGEGSSVSQGQTIGYVGATGRATGTHLHFEVFVNGSRTDPAGYFGGLSYYNC
ncbi:MAG: M23 family metallopeptidase, partial [Oscillospiraceae bacterium]|nr:M23 family metallopeptidase [Oscillospiraceae bacterium]